MNVTRMGLAFENKTSMRTTLLISIIALFGVSAQGADRCDAIFEPSPQQRLQPLPPGRSLVPVDIRTEFTSRFDFELTIERQNVDRLLDPRRAYLYYEKHLKELPSHNLNAIMAYKGTEYGPINSFLRSPPEQRNWAQHQLIRTIGDLDQAVDSAPAIPTRIALFRGMALSKPEHVIRPVGEIISDGGFVSTSLDVKVAVNFLGMESFGADTKTRIFQVILVQRPGGRGIFIDGSTNHYSEAEIILDRGSRFKILRQDWVTIDFKEQAPPTWAIPPVGFGSEPVPIPPPLPSPIATNPSSWSPLWNPPSHREPDPRQMSFDFGPNHPKPADPSWMNTPPPPPPDIPPSPPKAMKVLVQYVEFLP